jgi:hypothetical protein
MKSKQLIVLILPIILTNLILVFIGLISNSSASNVLSNLSFSNIFFLIILYLQITLRKEKSQLYLNYPIYYFSFITSLIVLVVSALFIIYITPLVYVSLFYGILFIGFLIVYLLLLLSNSKEKNRGN